MSIHRLFLLSVIAAFIVTKTLPAKACSSCGCTLNSDWAAQGLATGKGWRFDLRYDYFNQTDLRTGGSYVDRSSISLPNDNEIQRETINRNYRLGLNYSPNRDWGIDISLPYFDRFHTTYAEGDSLLSTSHTQSIGDLRLMGRYQGFSDEHSGGIQFGLKLPTGSIHNNFISGPQIDAPLDRGLQPGTGTTDLLLGMYRFGALNQSFDYFSDAVVQLPLDSRENFKPGTGLNINTGLRYVSYSLIVPQLQINVRAEQRESGANADIENSGAVLVYLSPGVTANINRRLAGFVFFQVPVYQHVNGLQIEPRFTTSIGLHYIF